MSKQLSAKKIAQVRAQLMAELKERHVITFTKNERPEYWAVSCDMYRERLIVREPVGKFLVNVIFSICLPTPGMVW